MKDTWLQEWQMREIKKNTHGYIMVSFKNIKDKKRRLWIMSKRKNRYLKCTRITVIKFSIVTTCKKDCWLCVCFFMYRWKRYLKLNILHQTKLLIKCESTIKLPWRMLGLGTFVTQRHTFWKINKYINGGQLNLLEEAHIFWRKCEYSRQCKI